ncbi:transglutaminase-like domain-containing protein [Aliiroseovarius sediminis]|uniref:transglutaminase-like domain-containing protein n=1 Tax=Aliiroseovarius sediminis TaxID=2925839 RepID=UPI001F576FD5|nr:transglutaminase-like domain-containing protein [Aliiroseovarius sediminis]MCI2395719.1 transglutaminase-like domain-containing protein [Aliiroseovarius sediminis]
MAQMLADADHALVLAAAKRLIAGSNTDREKLERIFLFVRDDIVFGFPVEGDLVPASKTLRTKLGQCNTKATLFLALCRASGVPARIHFSLIGKEIQRGFFTGIAYWLMPKSISHSWIEVEIEREWRRIDSFINDLPLHNAAERELARRGWTVGYSLALADGRANADLSVDEEAFEQMAAVTDDHGTWDDPADYYASAMYKNRPGPLKLLAYRLLIGRVNRRVEQVRAGFTAEK